jgi:hypothetical protein
MIPSFGILDSVKELAIQTKKVKHSSRADAIKKYREPILLDQFFCYF